MGFISGAHPHLSPWKGDESALRASGDGAKDCQDAGEETFHRKKGVWFDWQAFLQQFKQGFVYFLDRETDDIEIGPVDPGDAGMADPLLDGVGSGLVEGPAGIDIIGDFFVGQVLEPDLGRVGEGLFLRGGADGDGGRDVMLAAGKVPEHADGVFAIPGLSEDFAGTAFRRREDDHRVGRDQDFVIGQGAVEPVRLAYGHQSGNFIVGSVRTEVFVEVILCIYLEINV